MTPEFPTPVQPVPAPPDEALRSTAIDRSCRWPVLLLFAGAGLWLAFGGVFGFLTAIKAHAPGFLSGPSWLTYGRVRPAGTNAVIYGFILQAGLGLALWMFSRSGRTLLRGGWVIVVGCALWNVGLAIGIVGILAGGTTGHEWLELPAAASPALFVSFLLIGAWAIINLHGRQERTLYVSQWFLLMGLFCFPWTYSSAQMLLVYFPVRGVMQAVVAGWYSHALFEVCLGSFGLATIFYFLPKLLGRPLHSRGLVLFAFWLLTFLGGWGGVPAGLPAPNWLGSVSAVARVFLLLPMLAIGLSWYGTWAGRRRDAKTDPVLSFILVAAVSCLLTALLEAVGLHPAVRQFTAFTLYDQGVAQLRIHGFLCMALAGAVYYVAPRLGNRGLLWPGLVKVHFWCATLGMVLSSISLVVGGLAQGARINQPQIEFIQIVRGTLPFLGTSTLGATLLFLAYAAFGVQVWRLLTLCCPCRATQGSERPIGFRQVITGRTPA